MSQGSKKRSKRLAAYSALAGGVIPVAAAAGAIVSQTGLNIMATPGSPALIDFGPGFGEVFQFSVLTTSFTFSSSFTNSTGTFYSSNESKFRSNQVVQFNPGNTVGWSQASVIGNAPYGSSNDPRLLRSSTFLGPNAQTWVGMSSRFYTAHDLAARSYYNTNFFSSTPGGSTSSDSSSGSAIHGDWNPQNRGFVGLRFSDDGVDYYYAWFDVSVDQFNQKLTINGWAFNDEPNVGLHVPAPAAGLGMLALGAAGIRRSRGRAA